ncbi:MAG: hypothetical protein J5742_01590 [Alphaproteobacteria bacterium]|nr:hypothetical protein [Alphaproteobacteria bacterium]
MVKKWYMYAGKEFITQSNECGVRMQDCPAIEYVDSIDIKVVYEPVINRGFNVYFKSIEEPIALKNKILSICNTCPNKSK